MSQQSTADAVAMRRNLRLLPAHQALASTLAWLPIFVLFTRGWFGIDGALQLAGIFYFTTVIVEVPSGWASDRLGRVVTLKAAAVAMALAHVFFVISDGSFALVALGEVMLATGFSAISGTDVSLHYDTLEELGIEAEYEERQSKLTAISFAAVSASAVVGGLIGWASLELVFAFSVVSSVLQFIVLWWLAEPPQRRAGDAGQNFGSQLSSCLSYLRRPFLRWVLMFWIAMVTLEHVAFTLAQPYLTEALGFTFDDIGSTPVWTGFLFAVFSLIGAVAARNAASLRRRFGFLPLLLGLAVLSASIISAMLIVLSVWVALFMGLRSVLGAVAPTVLTSEIAPAVEQQHRATYLSIHSLAGRLVYGGLTYAAAVAIGDDLMATIGLFTIASWILIALVIAGWVALRPTLPAAVTSVT